MKEQEPPQQTEPIRGVPVGEGFAEELETDLLGLIGDMEDDLSQADEAVHEAHIGEILTYFESVLVEVNRAIYLLHQEVRRRTNREIELHSIEIDGVRYYALYKEEK